MKTKNVFLSILGTIVFSGSFSYSLAAQEQRSQLEILASYEWHNYLPEYEVLDIYIYTEDELNISSYLFKHSLEQHNTYPFYLSDEPDKEFDESKVGKAQNGKYIVFKDKNSRAKVDEIRTLNDEELVLKSMSVYVGGWKPRRYIAKEKTGDNQVLNTIIK